MADVADGDEPMAFLYDAEIEVTFDRENVYLQVSFTEPTDAKKLQCAFFDELTCQLEIQGEDGLLRATPEIKLPHEVDLDKIGRGKFNNNQLELVMPRKRKAEPI